MKVNILWNSYAWVEMKGESVYFYDIFTGTTHTNGVYTAKRQQLGESKSIFTLKYCVLQNKSSCYAHMRVLHPDILLQCWDHNLCIPA